MNTIAFPAGALARGDASSSEVIELLELNVLRPHAQVGAGQSALLVCTHGQLQVSLGLGEPELAAGQALLCSADTPLRASAGRGSAGLLLTLGHDTLRQCLRAVDPLRRFDPLLITARHADGARLIDAMQPLAGRHGAVGRLSASDLQRVVLAAVELDRRFDALLARCPGRTAAHRRQVLARFERTRQRFAWSPQRLDADVETLASSTNYTRWHFVRCFTAIYGESPAEFMRELRLRWCAEQLTGSDLAISEIAWMAGYGSHASFARAFRSHYGRCASEWRSQRYGSLPASVERHV